MKQLEMVREVLQIRRGEFMPKQTKPRAFLALYSQSCKAEVVDRANRIWCQEDFSLMIGGALLDSFLFSSEICLWVCYGSNLFFSGVFMEISSQVRVSHTKNVCFSMGKSLLHLGKLGSCDCSFGEDIR